MNYQLIAKQQGGHAPANLQGDELMEVVGIFIIFAIGIAIELIKTYKEKHDQDLRDRINKKGRQ